MSIRTSFVMWGVVAIGLILPTSVVVAQTAGTTVQTQTAPTATTSPGTRAAGIAAQYGTSVGTPEETGALIDGMRTGKDVTVGDVTVSGTGKSMGWGNVDIAMAMAKSQLAPDATSKDFLGALDQVMDMRSSGMGWGEIAKDLGVNLGQVMGAAKSGKSKQDTVAAASSRSGGAKTSGSTADKGQSRGSSDKQGAGGQAAGNGNAGGNNGNAGGNNGNAGGNNGNGGGNGGKSR